MSTPTDTTNTPAAADGASASTTGDMSKSARQRAEKQAKKDAEKAAKLASKAAAQPATATGDAAGAGAAGGDKKPKVAALDEEDGDPDQYYETRLKDLSAYESNTGRSLYPHKFTTDISIPQFVAQYSALNLNSGDRLEGTTVRISGRVYQKRTAGSSLVFYDLQCQGGRMQVVADKKSNQDDWNIHHLIRRGKLY